VIHSCSSALHKVHQTRMCSKCGKTIHAWSRGVDARTCVNRVDPALHTLFDAIHHMEITFLGFLGVPDVVGPRLGMTPLCSPGRCSASTLCTSPAFQCLLGNKILCQSSADREMGGGHQHILSLVPVADYQMCRSTWRSAAPLYHE